MASLVEEAPTREMLKTPKEDYTKIAVGGAQARQARERPGEDVLLRIHGVDATYGGVVKVLENVTVQVPRGRTVAVVGESGSASRRWRAPSPAFCRRPRARSISTARRCRRR